MAERLSHEPWCESFIIYYCVYLLGVGPFNLEISALCFWEIPIYLLLCVCFSFIVFPSFKFWVHVFIWDYLYMTVDLLHSSSYFHIYFFFCILSLPFCFIFLQIPQLYHCFSLLNFLLLITEFKFSTALSCFLSVLLVTPVALSWVQSSSEDNFYEVFFSCYCFCFLQVPLSACFG